MENETDRMTAAYINVLPDLIDFRGRFYTWIDSVERLGPTKVATTLELTYGI